MRIGKGGAIPIPYIIAIIFGVIVLALITYWLLFTETEFGKMVKENICEGKKARYCSDWKFSGSRPQKNGVDQPFSTSCDADTKDDSYAPDCCIIDWAADNLSPEECGITTS